jgi:hypothetical protein
VACEWFDLLSTPTITTGISTAAALVGVALGSRLTVRRERWTAKRDVYASLVQGIQQTRVAYSRMEAFYVTRPPAKDISTLVKDVDQAVGPALKDARDNLYRAMGIVRLTLNAAAVQTLNTYEEEDLQGTTTVGFLESLRVRRAALDNFHDTILRVGRGELKLEQLPQRPARLRP